jgi:hypothetical protein
MPDRRHLGCFFIPDLPRFIPALSHFVTSGKPLRLRNRPIHQTNVEQQPMSEGITTIAVTNSNGTNGMIVKTITVHPNDHVDYSWMLLALLALVLVVGGLREVFGKKASN